MWQKAYEAQCITHDQKTPERQTHPRAKLTLFTLAFGSFCIGTSEFASMGIIQSFARDLGIPIAQATNAIAAYAIGVVVGAPTITLGAARLNRRTLLLLLIALFVLGNSVSAMSTDLGTLMAARFITGLPQGAYFGAGAVVATHVVGAGRGGQAFALVMLGITTADVVGSPLATLFGQELGWRQTYIGVAILGAVALAGLSLWIPRTPDLDGGPVTSEIAAFKNPNVWLVIGVAALGISSIFAVYTFIGPFVTDAAHLSPAITPIALALFGIGMTVGNLAGGRIADAHPSLGITAGFGCTLVVLILLATWGQNPWIMMPALFGVGAFMMAAVPAIQVQLTMFAPAAPTLMGAMNLAALNTANALGAWGAGIAVGAGWGLLSAAWAGFVLTGVGLVLYLATVRPKVLQGSATSLPHAASADHPRQLGS